MDTFTPSEPKTRLKSPCSSSDCVFYKKGDRGGKRLKIKSSAKEHTEPGAVLKLICEITNNTM